MLRAWEQANALYAQMAEQVDASASKADVFGVRVRVSLWAPVASVNDI